MLDLWWTKWHWDRFFSGYFSFPCHYHFTNAPHVFAYHRGYLNLEIYSVVKQHPKIIELEIRVGMKSTA
jgi:hypothetical protein